MIVRRIPSTDRHQQLLKARADTDNLFTLLQSATLYDRPVPERHRLIFYLGHLEAFDWNLMIQMAACSSAQPELDRLFAFGIDPESGKTPSDAASDWPSVDEVHRYNRQVRDRLDDLLEVVSDTVLCVAIEHRLMHAETLAYLLHNLPAHTKSIPLHMPVPTGHTPAAVTIAIPAGTATLGQKRDRSGTAASFGWDNEFDAHEAAVPAFAISKYKVTNGEYLEFVRDGASAPHFWSRNGDQWFWRTMSGEIPLPLNWPVYVTHHEAVAYATWAGKTVPTEAQFHRAAYGSPDGGERAYPWGHDMPDARHGNFNGHRWDPVPVTATPSGDSAFGVSQLVGNGWEWTSTVFEPFPGFHPFDFYPGYSAPFFDGQHYVLKGASPRTAACFLRRSFRNWFRAGYAYVYAGFRCVEG
jgi:formylglycine-generating enzyme required for sulfatase activity